MPISSTAHIRIVPIFFGWSDPGAAVTAIIQLGTMFALLVYFLKDIKNLILAAFKSIIHRRFFETRDSKLAWLIVFGTIPIVVFGFAFKNHIETTARSLYLISISLLFFSVLLFIAEKLAKLRKSIDNISWFESQLMGFFQALALIPGASRSGVTITAGLLSGLNRESAARFSFLLSIPAVFASALFELWEIRSQIASIGIGSLIISVLTSGIVGYLSIEFLLKYLRKHNTYIFIVYRILIGVLILLLLQFNVIEPF